MTTKKNRGGETTAAQKKGKLQLKWEDCVKRDVRLAEEDDTWREKAANREKWKGIRARAFIKGAAARKNILFLS